MGHERARVERREAKVTPGSAASAAREASPAAGASSAIRPTAAQLLSAPGGAPLPAPVLQRMERTFGTGFGRVRVHRGAEADAFDAEAFTAGERIFLPKHGPSLTSPEGQSLLGHELTHVLQQRSGRVRAKEPGISVDPHSGLEAEAEAVGSAIARGAAPALPGHSRGPAPLPQSVAGVVQRRRGKQSKRNKKKKLADAPEAAAKRQERADRRAEADESMDDLDLGAALEMAENAPALERPAAIEAPTAVPKEANAVPKEAKAGAAKKGLSKRRMKQMKKQARALNAMFGPGAGSGNATVQQSDQALVGALSNAEGLAKQAEAASQMVAPAPAPSEDWAQPQPLGDPTSPPPLPLPELPQPEQPASIQLDPPMSPLTATAPPTKTAKEFKHQIQSVLGTQPANAQRKPKGK